MAHQHDHYRDHGLARDLAHRFTRESRHSDHPTQYIVNEGKMVIDQKTLRHSNAIIYNAPGSTLRFIPSKPASRTKPRHNSHKAPEPQRQTTAPPIHLCRGCQQHETYFGDYCHDCTSLELAWERYKQRDHDNHLKPTQSKRAIGWH